MRVRAVGAAGTGHGTWSDAVEATVPADPAAETLPAAPVPNVLALLSAEGARRRGGKRAAKCEPPRSGCAVGGCCVMFFLRSLLLPLLLLSRQMRPACTGCEVTGCGLKKVYTQPNMQHFPYIKCPLTKEIWLPALQLWRW